MLSENLGGWVALIIMEQFLVYLGELLPNYTETVPLNLGGHP